MRATIYTVLPLMLIGLYAVDKFQYDGEYTRFLWEQANAQVQVFQDELRAWFHRH